MAGNEDTRECEAMRKIFVGGLNKATTDEAFHEYFQQFGTTEDHIIIRDGTASRGFGFITYDASAAVEKVFQQRPHTIDGKTVDCKRAMPREVNTPTAHSKVTKLFVGGIKGDHITEEKLQNYFNDRHSGCSGHIVKIERVSGKPFGFIETSDHDFADRLVISEASFTIEGVTMNLQKSDSGAKGGAGGGRGRGGPRGGRGARGGGGMGRGGRGGRGGSFNRGGSNRGGSGGGNYNRGGYNNGYNQNNGYDQSGGYQQQGYQNYDQYNQSGYGAQQSQGGYNQGYSQQYNYDQNYGNYNQGYQNQGQNRYTPY